MNLQTTLPFVLREDHDGVATLTLNRGAQRNPLSEGMIAALAEQLARIASGRSVKAVVLAAHGPVFSAGRWSLMAWGTSNAAASGFADLVAGAKQER
jgi:enoyl-CoA hydratase/carnithine racemase